MPKSSLGFPLALIVSVSVWGAPPGGAFADYSAATITASFGAVAIPVGEATTLNFTLFNPADNPAPLTGIHFIDSLSAGLRVANPNRLTGSCVPISTITAAPGAGTISVAALALDPGGSCGFSVAVVGLTEGMQTSATGPVSSNEASGSAAGASVFVGPAFQVTYAANLDGGESYINLTNNGVNGAPLLGPGFGAQAGNICVNVYAFAPDEQLVSCCSCLITPNGLVNLGVTRDLTSKTLTPVVPSSVVVKLITTLPGEAGTGANCQNSAAMISGGVVAGGAAGWSTTIHRSPISPSGYATVETPIRQSTLSAGEVASLSGRCAFIIGNAGGFGICRSCQAGGLGGEKM